MHNRNSLAFLEACYRSDNKALAAKVSKSVKTDLQQQLKFYNSLSEKQSEWMAYDKKTVEDYLQALASIEQMNTAKPAIPENAGSINNPTPPGSK